MAKVWVLDTETKGTGANVVPLDKVTKKPEPKPERPSRERRPESRAPAPPRPRRRKRPAERTATGLPPGHVRKKATGEIGRVKAVDPKAGTATVAWLKTGTTSTVPLSALARR